MNKTKLKQAIWAGLLFIAIAVGITFAPTIWQVFNVAILIVHGVKTINLLSDK